MILADLQGHGRTAECDRPLDPVLMADDIAGLLDALELERADVMGYSLGGTVALRTAIQHPARVRRLVVVAVAFRRAGSYPEVLAAMDSIGPEAAVPMQASPAYAHYAAVAPQPEDWATHVAKTGELLRRDYDWMAQAAGIAAPVQLVYADADSVTPAHVAEVFALYGGGAGDPGWDGARRPAGRLAVLPGRTHYDLLDSPLLVPVVREFLAGA